jgi:integrase
MSSTNPTARVRVEPGIVRRGDTYEITYRDSGGHQRLKTVEGGLMAARKALTAAKAERNAGTPVTADPRLKFDTAADAWLAQYAEPNLRPGTVKSYRTALKRLRPTFGNRRLTEITPSMVAKYVKSKQAAGLKGETVRVHLTTMGAIFRYARRHLGYAGLPPTAALDRLERPNVSDARERRALTSSEVAAIIEHAPERVRLLFRFAIETGMRMSEVLGLVWSDLDLSDRPAVNVTAQLSRTGERAPLKTRNSKRRVLITSELAAALKAHKLASRYSADDDFVFASKRGAGRNYSNVARDLAATVERAGLDDGVTFHWFRHTFASRLIAAGWPVTDVASMVGDTVPTLTKVYAHAFDMAAREDDRREQLGRLMAM